MDNADGSAPPLKKICCLSWGVGCSLSSDSSSWVHDPHVTSILAPLCSATSARNLALLLRLPLLDRLLVDVDEPIGHRASILSPVALRKFVVAASSSATIACARCQGLGTKRWMHGCASRRRTRCLATRSVWTSLVEFSSPCFQEGVSMYPMYPGLFGP